MHNSYRHLYGMTLESCVSVFAPAKTASLGPPERRYQPRVRSSKDFGGGTTVIDEDEERAGVGRESFQRAMQA